MKVKFTDSYGLNGLGVSAVIIGLIAAASVLIFAVSAGICAYTKHLDAAKCDRLDDVLGQPTVWADYNYWDWDCLTEVDGQLVQADDYKRMIQLRLMDKAS